MSDSPKPKARNDSTRKVAIAAVALLIVVAIAGIVLAGRKSEESVAAAAPPLPAAAASVPVVAAATSTPVPAPAPTDAPDEIIFARGSDRLPAGGFDRISAFVDAARKNNRPISIHAGMIVGGGRDQKKDRALAMARTSNVRHAVEANGMSSHFITVQVTETSPGNLTERQMNRVQLIER